MSKVKQKTIVAGNGINRAIEGNGISWGQLLEILQASFNAKHIDLTNSFKPFPLSFEEILFAAKGSFDENIRTIKSTIAQKFFDVEPNELHKKIVDSGIQNIITTNYDYCFEKCIVDDFDNSTRLKKRTREHKHSIQRRCYFEDSEVSVWHIHGEINHLTDSKSHYPSESILIGYDHYVEYLSEMQSYLYGRKYKEEGSINDKIKKGLQGSSWIDSLFNSECFIIGVELDFSEIDLWWLLNFRKKFFKRNSFKPNTITYYQPRLAQKPPKDDFEEFSRSNEEAKIKAKKDVMESLDINFEEILCNDYREFYCNVFTIESI